jgi:hypothetical protein
MNNFIKILSVFAIFHLLIQIGDLALINKDLDFSFIKHIYISIGLIAFWVWNIIFEKKM